MRILLILIIIIAFSYPFSMPGQEQTVDVEKLKQKKVYLNAENSTLEKVILSLSESLKLKIIYRSDSVKKIKINMELVWIPFEQALQKLLYPHNLTYFFTPDGTVIIASSSQEQWSMTGKITDSKTGEPLAGVNVYVENTSLGCATDKDGRYQIDGISPGVHRLVVRMMGYKEIKEYIFHEGKKIVRRNFSLEQEALQMQEIQIVAKMEKVILKREVSRFSIKPRNISMIPSHGEMDIFRTIQFLPGVVMTSEFKSQLYIRGGNSDQNLVLLDGGIIYNPFHFSGILSAFDVDAIDEVDFIAGGFQSEYGSRLSSVVDIKTRKGADKFSGRLNISPISIKSMIEGPIWSWGNYLFTGRKSYVSGTAKKMGGSVEPEFYDGIGRIEVRPTWRDRIIISSFFGKDSVRLQDENRTKGIKSENISSAFNYHRNFCNWFNTSLRATYGEFKTEVPQPLNKDEPQKNEMEDRSYDFKMELALNDGLSFKVGANYHEIRVKYKSADPIIPEIKIDKRLFESAFFIQNYMKVKEKWIFETGLRMTRYDESMPFIFEPRFNVQYNRYNFLTLKGAYGRFSQNLVTIFNENDNYNPVDIWLPPDPDLPIATADHLILGCSYHTIDLIISAETYWKKYYHLTHYNRERISPEDPFFVQGKGYGLGVDLSLQLIIRLSH